MRRSWMGIAAVLGLVNGITTTSWTGSIEPQSGKGVFVGLKVGLPVTLKEVGVVMRSGFWTTPEQHVAALKGTDDLVGNGLADVVLVWHD